MQIGDPASDHELVGPDGPVRLSALWATGPLLLVFYPGDFTPVCTRQLCSYRDDWQDFQRRGVRLVGINPAGADRHRAFRERHGFPFPLLTDADGACCRAYGASAWYGTRRQTVLIADGRVRWQHATLPFLKPSSAELLAAVDALGAHD
jgi:peroxiredoxin Q/BCP